jgi:hypothetical protein
MQKKGERRIVDSVESTKLEASPARAAASTLCGLREGRIGPA